MLKIGIEIILYYFERTYLFIILRYFELCLANNDMLSFLSWLLYLGEIRFLYSVRKLVALSRLHDDEKINIYFSKLIRAIFQWERN